MEIKVFVVSYIKEKLRDLEELSKYYNEEKIDTLATKLVNTNKSFEELKVLIDNKFSNQVRKINHNNHLSSLKEYYISSIDKLSKDNNCYLLSYKDGVKILEQANINKIKDINESLSLVKLNKRKLAYRKENSINNDYELIISDIAFLLNIPYNTTYRIFDSNMNADGVLNEANIKSDERFLNLEETLKFIQEESPKFNLKTKITDFHDKQVKHGIRRITNESKYKEQIEYVFDLFKSLPDITDRNYNELKHDYLNMLIFELLINSINNNLSNIGIIISKNKNNKYSYRLSSSYNKYTMYLDTLDSNETICNFYIVDKKELLNKICLYYYEDVKELLTLIVENKDSLESLIDQVIKEHLEYSEYNKYHNNIINNLNMFNNVLNEVKNINPDNKEDRKIFDINNEKYNRRIEPFKDNYVVEDVDSSKGSVVLTTIIALVLLGTLFIIFLVILAISKLDM